MFNGFSAIRTMSETRLFCTASCRNSDSGHGVQKRGIRIILRIDLLKKERSIEPISGKKSWANLTTSYCLPIHKPGNFMIKKGGPDMKLYWMCIPILLLPEFF